ncbi:hypothetical protein EVAR_39799_1 [Eumeta japonica]|uniref:Secreted protein n=1 Tax=Eumeta variegata TaxID=151549 RepID=A0A4C1X506_EUMVA|nr:hypothetical protein EVAR_39799_1 [Eumeta japonica]
MSRIGALSLVCVVAALDASRHLLIDPPSETSQLCYCLVRGPRPAPRALRRRTTLSASTKKFKRSLVKNIPRVFAGYEHTPVGAHAQSYSVTSTQRKQTNETSAARGRPIIVEWERRKAFGGPLSFGDSSLRYRALHFFISDSQPQPNLRRCHVKTCYSREKKSRRRKPDRKTNVL